MIAENTTAESLARRADDRRVPDWRVARAGHVITPQSHFIAPIDRRALAFGVAYDRGVLALEPLRNRGIVALVRAPHRFLGTHAPRVQIPAGRRQRHRHAEFPRDQRDDRRARPEIEAEFVLIGHLIENVLAHPRRLRGRQSAFPRAAAARLGRERAQAALARERHPLVHGAHTHLERRGRLRLGHPAAHRLHRQPPDLRLRYRITAPSIRFCRGHVFNLTHVRTICCTGQ